VASEDGDGEPRPQTADEGEIVVKMDGDSDNDFALIDIKERVLDYWRANGRDKHIDQDTICDAIRWRLERNDC